MKIVIVGHNHPSVGHGVSIGIARYAYYLAQELNSLGHDAKLVIRDEGVGDEDWLVKVKAPKASWLYYPFFAARKVKQMNADVFHADYVTTNYALHGTGKKPRVASIHDVIPLLQNTKTLATLKDRLGNAWYKFCFKKVKYANAVTLLTETARQEAIELTDIPEEKLFVSSVGVDENTFFPLKNKKHEGFKIGYLGGCDLVSRKNVGLLVKGFVQLREKYPDAELHLAGPGSKPETFKGFDLSGFVFHGFVPDDKINEYYNSLDVFVFPSLGEGFGLPPVEAMSAGTPVVACNSTTMPEIIGDAGMLIENNVQSMFEVLEKLYTNRKQLKPMSKKGLVQAKKYTWKTITKQTVDIYSKVVE